MEQTVYFNHDSRFDHITLQNCVLQYQETKNEFLLHAILYKLKGTINHVVYNSTNYPDKLELIALCEDTILSALKSYNKNMGLFTTYFTACIKNAIINLVKSSKIESNQLSIDYEYELEDGEDSLANNIVSNDNDIVDTETRILLESLKECLTENEYKVCEAILADNHNLTQTDISRSAGLTVPAIKLIFKRLQKRFVQHRVFCKNF